MEYDEPILEPGVTTTVLCTTFREGYLNALLKIGAEFYFWDGQPFIAELKVLDITDNHTSLEDD